MRRKPEAGGKCSVPCWVPPSNSHLGVSGTLPVKTPPSHGNGLRLAPGFVLVMVLLALMASPAAAQDRVYIVCDPTRDIQFTTVYPDAEFFRVLHTSAPTDDDPFDPDISAPIGDGEDVLIIVDREGPAGGPVGVWDTDAITIDQTDVRIRILGARSSVNTEIVVQRAAGNATYDLISVEGDGTELRIENLTLTGADDASAVAVTSAADEADLLVTQCHIYGNQIGVEAGDATGPDSRALLVNCSIRANEDGVVVHDNALVEVLFCSILYNTQYGVHAEVADAARVWNSLVYLNPDPGGAGDFQTDATANIHAAHCYLTQASAATVVEDVPLTVYDSTVDVPVPTFVGDPSDPLDTTAWGKIDFAGGPFVDGRIPGNWFALWEPDTWGGVPGDFAWDPINYVYDDFEGEVRPQGLAEIGADERDLGLPLLLEWDYCLVLPQDPYESVGLTVPGLRELTFEVWVGFTGATPPVDVRAWFIPQGGLDDGDQFDPTDIDDWVTIDIAAAAMEVAQPATTPLTYFPTVDLWRGEGRILSTVIDERDADGGIPSINDLIADGHAAIYLQYSDGTDWFKVDPASVLRQAQIGRHFLIDTIPPDLLDTPKNAVNADPTLVEISNVLGHNGTGVYGAQGVIPSLLHPYPALPATWRPVSVASPPDAPYDEGLIYAEPTTGQGAQAFFNAGSYSDNAAPSPEALDIRLEARFWDPPVRDAGGVPIDGIDQFSDAVNRQVTGFPPTTNTTQGVELLEAAPLVFSEGGEILTSGVGAFSVDVLFDPAPTYTHDDPAVQNQAFDYQRPATELSPQSVVPPGPEDVVTMRWRFESDDGATTESGIHWIGDIPQDYLHLATKLVAIDLAGNARLRNAPSTAGASDYPLAPDPLHLWWMLRARTRVMPNSEGQRVPSANLDTRWGLERDYDPRAAGQPEPLFTYRLWRSTDGTNDPVDWEPIPGLGWSSWSPDRILGPSDWDAIIAAAAAGGTPILDEYVLLVVAGADESGNVEQWPWTDWFYDLYLDGSEFLGRQATAAPAGTNWQRFFIESPGTALDTTAQISFAHQHTTNSDRFELGSNRIVPVPADGSNFRLQTVFELGISYDGFGPATDIVVEWEFVNAQGGVVLSGTTTSYGSTQEVKRIPLWPSVGLTLDVDLKNANSWPTNANREVPMVFRAWADLDSGTAYDTTPVNIPFTLVWRSVTNYVSPIDDIDEQPVKEQRKE
jgi:Right handed beta helix region